MNFRFGLALDGSPIESWLEPSSLGALALWLANGKQAPERMAVEAPLLEVQPTAKGHGVARPGATWQAVSRVSGTVTYQHRKPDGPST